MTASVDIECDTVHYQRLRLLASLGLVVYTIGYLLFTSLLLSRLYLNKSFSNTRCLLRFGFIYERFELGYVWTAIMSKFQISQLAGSFSKKLDSLNGVRFAVLVIRIGFVMSVILSGNPLSTAAALAMITVVWLLVHVYTLPYVDDGTDVLQTFLLVSLMALGYAGVMFSESKLPPATKQRFTYGGVLVIGLMVIAFIVLFCKEVIGKIKMRVRASIYNRGFPIPIVSIVVLALM